MIFTLSSMWKQPGMLPEKLVVALWGESGVGLQGGCVGELVGS